ncbi:MAG: phosphonate transport system ATP-binding protein [Rhodoferax sp.]
MALREGELIFDLPASAVTPQHLQDLYAQNLHELTGPARSSEDYFPVAPSLVVMNCR